MQMMKKQINKGRKIFNRENIAKTFWSLMVAIIIFLAGIYYNEIKNPEKVEIINTRLNNDTVYLKMDQGDIDRLNDVDKYIALLEHEFNSKRNKEKDNETSLEDKLNKNNLEKDKIDIPPKKTVDVKNDINYAVMIAEPLIGKYKLPDIVEGYLYSSVGAYASVILENSKVSKNNLMRIHVKLVNDKILKEASPIIVTILKKIEGKNITQLARFEYILKSPNSVINVIADYDPGNYIIRTGFYIEKELNTKYPPFYFRDTYVTIN